jgi:hypothetical protein
MEITGSFVPELFKSLVQGYSLWTSTDSPDLAAIQLRIRRTAISVIITENVSLVYVRTNGIMALHFASVITPREGLLINKGSVHGSRRSAEKADVVSKTDVHNA